MTENVINSIIEDNLNEVTQHISNHLNCEKKFDEIEAVVFAAGNGSTSILELFYHNGFSLDVISSQNGFTPFLSAVANGHVETARRCIDLGASMSKIHAKNNAEAIHFAVNCLEMFNFIVLHGSFSIDSCDTDGATALHLASAVGNDIIVENLLHLGFSPSVIDKNGRTALHVALYCGNVDACMVILKYDSSMVYTEDLDGASPLHLVESMGLDKILTYIKRECISNSKMKTFSQQNKRQTQTILKKEYSISCDNDKLERKSYHLKEKKHGKNSITMPFTNNQLIIPS